MSQFCPSHPMTHLHLYDPSVSTQVPPFLHRPSIKHSFLSTNKYYKNINKKYSNNKINLENSYKYKCIQKYKNYQIWLQKSMNWINILSYFLSIRFLANLQCSYKCMNQRCLCKFLHWNMVNLDTHWDLDSKFKDLK